MTYAEIRSAVRDMYDDPRLAAKGLSGATDVSEVNEQKVQAVYTWLRDSPLSEVSKRKRWAICKRLIHHLWESNLIPLPRNLASRSMRLRHADQGRQDLPARRGAGVPGRAEAADVACTPCWGSTAA